MTSDELAHFADGDPTVIKAYTGFTEQGVEELLSPADRLDAIKKRIPAVLDRINLEKDWDFNTDTTGTGSDIVTSANKSIYRVEGKGKKARDIISILYGVDENNLTPLDEYSTVDADDMEHKVGLGGVFLWKQAPRVSDFPHFELVVAPTSAGLCRVNYRLKTLKIELFPSSFDILLQWGLLAELVPRAFEVKYADMLSLLASRHQGKGREYARVRQDPDLDAQNSFYVKTRGPY